MNVPFKPDRKRAFEVGTIAVPDRVKLILRLLTEAADACAPCPTNAAIAKAIGSTSIGTASDAVTLLETMGVITVERGNTWRVVTIAGTGRSTLATSNSQSVPSASAREIASAKRAENRRERIRLFCDALSAGTSDAPVSVKDAGRVAGVSIPTAHSFMKEVCADLGWQAV